MNKKLKIFLISISLLLIASYIFIEDIKYSYYDFREYLMVSKSISWQPNLNLTWDDFVYDPDKKLFDNISTHVAITGRYEINADSIMYRSRTLFFPKTSYVSDTTNLLTLRIANVRFDLAEVYRRKLDLKIESFRGKNSVVNIDSLRNKAPYYFNLFEKEWSKFLNVHKDNLEQELLALEERTRIELE